MKSVFLTFVIVCQTFTILIAQQYKIERSVPFEQPEYGWNKLLQLKNGNTLFFHAGGGELITVSVYDKNRKEIARNAIASKPFDVRMLQNSKIAGLFEIKGEAVLFLVQSGYPMSTLYRLHINAATGELNREDELGSLNTDSRGIMIEKDPQSNNYAAIFFNVEVRDNSNRIRVIHYDSSHKIINNALYQLQDTVFKHLYFVGCVVDGGKRLFMITCGHSGRSDDTIGRVILSRLDKENVEFIHRYLSYPMNFEDAKSVLLYNRSNNQLQLLSLFRERSTTKFMTNVTTTFFQPYLSHIDPETLSLVDLKEMNGQKVYEYAQTNIDAEYVYSGLPQHMIIEKDNTTTILFEETLTATKFISNYNQVLEEKSSLGAIGISELAVDGTEMSGYAIAKKQKSPRGLSKLYISERSKGVYLPLPIYQSDNSNAGSIMSFDYINTPIGRHIIFNDLLVNYEEGEGEKKRKLMTSGSGSNTICIKLNEGRTSKFLLFGEPGKRGRSIFSYISSSDYNEELSTYATIIIECTGRGRQAKIAWVTFE